MRAKHLCGFADWHPQWLQKFANIKTFMIVYGLLGTTQGMAFLYFIVTLTTIEKRFKIPSATTGIILSGNELSQIMLSLFLSYVGGQRNRPKWISWGMIFCSMSCFILALPHFIYGPGDDALLLTKEYFHEYKNVSSTDSYSTSHSGSKGSNNKLCLGVVNPEKCHELFSVVPLVLLFMSQFILGIGTTLYFSLGQSYLDDNTVRSNSPMMLAYAMSLRMFGPLAGYGLGYLSLKLYIDPTKTPLIDNQDPRWLGAWWIGWIFLGIPMMLFSFLIRMFPRQIAKKRSKKLQRISNEAEPFNDKDSEPNCKVESLIASESLPKLKDFPKALMRLLKNKILIYNITSTIFYLLGSTGHVLFLSKYIEVQFNKSPSDATILTGPVTAIGIVSGLLLSGMIITRYKPRPRILFFWNVIVGACCVAGQLSYMFLTCEHSSSMNLAVNQTSSCNMNCFCDGVAYSPVCSVKTGTTFFSPCHAACNQWHNEKKVYSGCSCAANSLNAIDNDSTPSNNFPASTTFTSEMFDSPIYAKISQHDDVQQQTGRRKIKAEIFKNVMVPGTCLTGCATQFYLFTFIMFAVNWLGSTGKIGNILVNLRAVADTEKSFSQGLALMLVSMFAFTPGPIIYGYIIDSTCLVWNFKCGNRGNCQLYDPEKFRYYVNLTAISLTFVAVVFDLLIWRLGKNINLYGEPEEIDCYSTKRTEQTEEQTQMSLLISGNS